MIITTITRTLLGNYNNYSVEGHWKHVIVPVKIHIFILFSMPIFSK